MAKKDENLTALEKAWLELVAKILDAATLTLAAEQSIIKGWDRRQDILLGKTCEWWADYKAEYEKEKWDLWADLSMCNLHYLFN